MIPDCSYMFKVNNTNLKTRYKICSKLTIKALAVIINFAYIPHLFLMFLLLTSRSWMPAGIFCFMLTVMCSYVIYHKSFVPIHDKNWWKVKIQKIATASALILYFQQDIQRMAMSETLNIKTLPKRFCKWLISS